MKSFQSLLSPLSDRNSLDVAKPYNILLETKSLGFEINFANLIKKDEKENHTIKKKKKDFNEVLTPSEGINSNSEGI